MGTRKRSRGHKIYDICMVSFMRWPWDVMSWKRGHLVLVTGCVTCTWLYVCRRHGILCRWNEKLVRSHGMLYRGNVKMKSWIRDMWQSHDFIYIMATTYYVMWTSYYVVGRDSWSWDMWCLHVFIYIDLNRVELPFVTTNNLRYLVPTTYLVPTM